MATLIAGEEDEQAVAEARNSTCQQVAFSRVFALSSIAVVNAMRRGLARSRTMCRSYPSWRMSNFGAKRGT